MKGKTFLIGALSLSLSMAMLSGCGTSKDSNTGDSAAAESTTAVASVENTDQADSKSFGIVESVDTKNNNITIRIMTEKTSDDSSSDSKEGNSDSSDSAESSTRPEKPDGNFDPKNLPEGAPEGGTFDPDNKPEGAPEGGNFDPDNLPEGAPEGGTFDPDKKPEGGNFDPSKMPGGGNMETKTYNLTSSTVITDKDGNTITADDLEENAFVEFVVDGYDLVSITVSDAKNRPEGKAAPDGKTGASEGNTSVDGQTGASEGNTSADGQTGASSEGETSDESDDVL